MAILKDHLKEILTEFYAYLIDTGLKDDTIDGYHKDTEYFLQMYQGVEYNTEKIKNIFSHDNIYSFINSLGKGKSSYYAIKKLIEFFLSKNIIMRNDYYDIQEGHVNLLKAIDLDKEKTGNDEIPFLTKDDIEFIFSDKIEYRFEENRVKDKDAKYILPVIISLSYFFGFEQKHLKELKQTDIDLEKKLVVNVKNRVDSDNNLYEVFEMNDYVYQAIGEYINYRKEKYGLKRSEFLIIEGKVADTRAINSMLEILQRAENSKKLSCSVDCRLLIRSMILQSLINTDGASFIALLRTQGKNDKQLQHALNEYLRVDIINTRVRKNLARGRQRKSMKNSVTNENDEDDSFEKVIELYSLDNDINVLDVMSFLNDEVSSKNSCTSKITLERLIRTSSLSDKLKVHYGYGCQLCGRKLPTNNIIGYIAEAHHIKPYNKLHKGDDTIGNMIILCPNCHTQFDDFYYAINPENLKVYCRNKEDINYLKEIKIIPPHKLSKYYLEYAWEKYVEKNET